MQILDQAKEELLNELEKFARRNIIKKLEKQGISYFDLNDDEFEMLVADEKEILKSDSKKVGMGVGIGIAISLLTGI